MARLEELGAGGGIDPHAGYGVAVAEAQPNARVVVDPELLRRLLAASDRPTICHRLHRFHEAALLADVPEATPLA